MSKRDAMEVRLAKLEDKRVVWTTILEISQALGTITDEEKLLQLLSRLFQKAGSPAMDLIYFDLNESGQPQGMETVARWNRESGVSPVISQPSQFPLSLWLADSDQIQLVSDVSTDERIDADSKAMAAQVGFSAWAVVPLNYSGHWVGLLVFTWPEAHNFCEWEKEIYDALIGLITPVVNVCRASNRLENAVIERTQDVIAFKTLIDYSPDGVAICDPDGLIVYANRAFYDLFGYDYQGQALVALPLNILWPQDMASFVVEDLMPQAIIGNWRDEVQQRRKDGSLFEAHLTASALRDENGDSTGIAVIVRDITTQKQAAAERDRLRQEIITAQKRSIQELSSPIIPVLDRVIVMPLVGSIDTIRSKEITRALLSGISQYRARIVILDVTGVPIVDSGVAAYLNKTIQAARLKGAYTILTGISDAVAETVVELGLDWSGIETLGSMQAGLLAALSRLEVKLVHEKKIS